MGQNKPFSFYHTESSVDNLLSRDDSHVSDGGGGDKPSERRIRSLSFHEAQLRSSKTFVISDVEKTKTKLLSQEDTNKDYQITVEDKGPKDMSLGSADSDGWHRYHITGHYAISNLLQELQLHSNSQMSSRFSPPFPMLPFTFNTDQYERENDTSNDKDNNDNYSDNDNDNDNGRDKDENGITWPLHPRKIIMKESILRENPVVRLSRMISLYFWKGLVRKITNYEELIKVCNDPKDRNLNKKSRIYIPHDDHDALDYYEKILRFRKKKKRMATTTTAEEGGNIVTVNETSRSNNFVEIIILPKEITLEYIHSLNKSPGLLCLDFRLAYVVPGGRFNEMYGWDSFFILLGLLEEEGNVSGNENQSGNESREVYGQLATNLVNNLCYQIRHYGKVLNANRTYYLSRSQPPLFLEMAMRIHEKKLKPLEWLVEEILPMAIREYEQVWTSSPRYIEEYGLSRYYDEGFGMPPETESSHYNGILKTLADELNISIEKYREDYNNRIIENSSLDEFFIHDRAVRESGHDTTSRLEGKAANLFTVDLNSLLFKVEMNIVKILELANQNSGLWRERARKRRERMNELMWDREAGLWFDYDFVKKERTSYESVTTLWPLWAGLCTKEQIELTIEKALPKFEMTGGLVSGTRESIQSPTSLLRPNRQWDYPYGWAPHQIIAWEAFLGVDKQSIARRLAYRWLYTITKAFYDYNGVVPEKFNIVTMSHRVDAEYGNQGIDFKCVSSEGFGWTNSSYQIGLSILTLGEKRTLGALVPPDKIFFK